MATFSINQVRHFYVVNAAADVEAKVSSDKKSLRFAYNSPGGKEGTDIIDVDKILYAKYTDADDMKYAFKTKTITVNSAPVAGEVYAIKVLFTNYAGGGDDNITVKYADAAGSATVKTADQLAAVLRDTLTKNLKDLVPLATVSGTGANIVITEVEQPWEAGIKPFTVMPFTVEILPVADSTEWASVASSEAVSGTNGKKIADMEWFYSGARGDMYRGYGHPNGVKTKLVANAASDYDTVDIHYAYVGPNEGAQKSEKTITFAGTSTTLKAVTDALAAIGKSVVTA